MKNHLATGLFLLLLGMSGSAMAGECYPEVVWLLRHVEKAVIEGERDPPLSAVGEARAQALVAVLAPRDPQTIYSTDYRRTRDTAGPLAAAAGIEIIIVDARDSEGLIDSLFSKNCDQRVVVVGHSNTVPALIRGLGVDEDIVLDEETGYGDLFAVRWAEGRAQLERARFGD